MLSVAHYNNLVDPTVNHVGIETSCGWACTELHVNCRLLCKHGRLTKKCKYVAGHL